METGGVSEFRRGDNSIDHGALWFSIPRLCPHSPDYLLKLKDPLYRSPNQWCWSLPCGRALSLIDLATEESVLDSQVEITIQFSVRNYGFEICQYCRRAFWLFVLKCEIGKLAGTEFLKHNQWQIWIAVTLTKGSIPVCISYLMTCVCFWKKPISMT